MTTRRKLLIAVGAGALAVPLASFAQPQSAKVPRIGFLGSTSPSSWARQVEAVRAGLRDLGYVEGKNIVIEFRWADGHYDRLPALAAELVRLRVDVIITHGTPGTLAAKQATTTIPIVIAAVGDAVASGLVASIARPGGNVTGSSFFNPELMVKRLELLKEAFPYAKRIAVLLNPDNRGNKANLQAMETATQPLNLELQPFAVRGPNEFMSAFAAMAESRVDAVVINEDPMIIANAKTIGEIASQQPFPSIGFKDVAEAGGLMAYGVNLLALYRRTGFFVDKLLKGAKPAELPVERATTFELVVNRKTAKAIGFTIPQWLLVRADEVID